MDNFQKSELKIYDRLINPVAVSFPIAAFALSFGTFLTFQMNDNPFWYQAGYFTNVVGVIAALIGSTPWLMDWVSGIPKGSHVRYHSARQGIFGIAAFLLFAVSWYSIRGTFNLIPQSVAGQLIMTGLGLISSLIAGYHAFAMMAENQRLAVGHAPDGTTTGKTYEFTRKAG